MIHEWCLICLTPEEREHQEPAAGPRLEINLEEYGVLWADQFVTYNRFPRPFVVAEAVERTAEDRTLLTITQNDVWLLQEGRGALANPQLLSPLERRVMQDTFWPRLQSIPVWRRFMEPVQMTMQTEAQRSKREMTDDLDDGWSFRVHDTREHGVVLKFIAPPPPDHGTPLELDEDQVERLYEHVQWCKEGRKTS